LKLKTLLMKKLFKNKKVLIMGLGLHGGGVGVVKFFCKNGAKVTITDLKTKNELKESISKLKNYKINYVLGKHREKDFINSDLIIKNPDVRRDSYYLKIAQKHNILIETDITLFFKLCKSKIIGITGTKGKSTAATLIYQFLKEKYPVILAGNIGVSPLSILSKTKKETLVVLELSSFELEDLKQSPQIAIITNLFPDHLNRYKSFKDYVNSKKAIFKYQTKDDVLFLNYDDPLVRNLKKEAKGKVYFYKGNSIDAAIAVAKYFKIPKKNIKKVLSNFKGIPHRQQFIGIKRGVKYFNDSAATNPESVILAIKNLKNKFKKSKIILIAGGVDKNLNYSNLVSEINKNISDLILFPGSASLKIKKELKKEINLFLANSMEEAVKKASSVAKKGDIVLLSPGAASFNLFKNEFDRGDQFIKYVKN